MNEHTGEGAVKGLDLGTSRIVVARKEGDRFEYSHQLNAFVALPYSRITETMLKRENILHTVEGDEIFAYGERVDQFANLLGGDTRRPMQSGVLNPREPKSLPMIELAIREICSPAREGEKICFSVPAAPSENESDLLYHERTIKQILEALGYRVMSLNEGLAIVYAELESTNFTGIGVSFGGGMYNMCVSYLGLPAVSFSTGRAGDYIDRSAASVSGETITTVRLHKEAGFSLNGLSTNSVDQALTVYYGDVLNAAVSRLSEALGATKKLPKLDRPVPVVVAGGSALAGGFREELEKALRGARLPIDISEVRLAEDPLTTTAKGVLTAAMLDM